MFRNSFFASVLFCGCALYASAQAVSPKLLVLSKRDHTLAVVDGTTLKVLGKAPVGDDPHEVIASSDGTRAYVSNYGGGTLHTLAVISLLDPSAPSALPSVDLGPLGGPHGLAYVDGKVWFTAEGAKVIGSYSPETGRIDFVLGTGQNRTHMIYVAPGAQHIVTTNVASGTVDFIDRENVAGPPPGGPPPGAGVLPPGRGAAGPPRFDWNETVVKVGNGSEGFDVSPDGREVWVANAGDGTISVIDRAAKAVTATLNVDVKSANRLKFTPDGRFVLVSLLNAPDLVVVDAKTHTVVKRLAIGHGAAGMVIEPDGARAFVACTPDSYVAVVDLKTLTVVGKIDAGGEPDGMDWIPGK